MPISVMLTAKAENTGSICPMISSPRGRRVRARDGTLPHRDPGRAGGHGRREKAVRHRSRIRRSPDRDVSGSGTFDRVVQFILFSSENNSFLIFPLDTGEICCIVTQNETGRLSFGETMGK